MGSMYDYRWERKSEVVIAKCKKCGADITEDTDYYDFLSEGTVCFECIDDYRTRVEREG